MSGMYCTEKICKECGSKLYMTALGQKLFCKKCYEYKKIAEVDAPIFKWDLK